MIALGYADQGSGFAREQPETAENRDFWRAVDVMLYDDVRQPPEDVRSTVGHPVWGLRMVEVGKARLRHWCFTVQGRDGSFGLAGTCRFAFFPESVRPGEVWAAGRE